MNTFDIIREHKPFIKFFGQQLDGYGFLFQPNLIPGLLGILPPDFI